MQRSSPPPVARPLALALLAAVAIAGIDASAQTPSVSREELMRKWDLDHDGKVDESEAEIARSRMRRSRIEAQQRSRIDPLTGRPRDDGGQRPAWAGRGEEDPMIVPGDGVSGRGAAGPEVKRAEPPRRTTAPAAEDDEGEADRERRRSLSRPALPGNRSPELSAPLPSVRPPSVTPELPPTSIRRPGGAAAAPTARAPAQPWQQLRGQPGPASTPGSTSRAAAGSPGIIAGGIRAGGSPARPGYGGSTAGGDLNAGRLQAGPPQSRGRTAGSQSPAVPGGRTPVPPAAGGTSAVGGTIVGGSRPLPAGGQGGVGGLGTRAAAPGSQPLSAGPRLPAPRPTTSRPPTSSPDDYFSR